MGAAGIRLTAIDKFTLFPGVAHRRLAALKSFSMGEARGQAVLSGMPRAV
jgi:hypothetical protein